MIYSIILYYRTNYFTLTRVGDRKIEIEGGREGGRKGGEGGRRGKE